MDSRTLQFVNDIKNEALRTALLQHGIEEGSKLEKVVNYMRENHGSELVNSTESRMTLYTAEINPYLYPDSSFLTKSVNDAQFAASGEIKRLNDSVGGPTVTKGRFYPQSLANGDNAPTKTVKVRKNTGHDWAIEYFHTTPDAITQELTREVPYEVRGELLRAHSDILNLSVANFAAVEWAQGEVGVAETVDTSTESNFFLFTTGVDKDGNVKTRDNLVAGTGTVNKVCQDDFKRMQSALFRQQIMNGTVGGGMYFLPTVEQYGDIVDPLLFPNFIDYAKTGRQSRLDMGEAGSIYGITVLQPRHREDWNANIVYSYTALSGNNTDLTKIEDTASVGASMVSAGMAWSDNMVLRAQGSAIVFPWQNSPIYLGDVYASELRFGAKKKRLDNKGVVMLVENPFAVQGG